MACSISSDVGGIYELVWCS